MKKCIVCCNKTVKFKYFCGIWCAVKMADPGKWLSHAFGLVYHPLSSDINEWNNVHMEALQIIYSWAEDEMVKLDQKMQKDQ